MTFVSGFKRHFSTNPGRLWIAGLTLDKSVTSTIRIESIGVCEGVDGREGMANVIKDATPAGEKNNGHEADVVHKVHATTLRDPATIDKAEEVLSLWQEWIGR